MTEIMGFSSLCERRMYMGNSDKMKKSQQKVDTPSKPSAKVVVSVFWKKLTESMRGIISNVVVVVVVANFYFIYDFNTKKDSLDKIPSIVENVETLVSTTDELKNHIVAPDGYINTKFSAIEAKLEESNISIAKLQQAQEDYERILPYATSPYEFLSKACFGITYDKDEDIYSLNKPTWESTEIIARDRHTMQEYSAKDLEGELLLVPYMDDGQEIYFLGRYNSNNQWEGDCVINVYKNNRLSLITEAYYESGELKSYRQVVPFTTARGKAVWAISNRLSEGLFNRGNTWSYYKDDDIIKDFDMDTVTYGEILHIDDFRNSNELLLEGFYHGNTANGNFNDETGDAYLVKYFPDGTVRTLYSGRFKNGQFNDNSGQAWNISKEKEEDDYIFRNDIYKNGKPAHRDKYEVLTQEKLAEVLKGRNFDCELTGLVDKKA